MERLVSAPSVVRFTDFVAKFSLTPRDESLGYYHPSACADSAQAAFFCKAPDTVIDSTETSDTSSDPSHLSNNTCGRSTDTSAIPVSTRPMSISIRQSSLAPREYQLSKGQKFVKHVLN